MVSLPVAEKEVRIIKRGLAADETVELTVKERRLRPGGALITPTTFIVTNKRLIIVERSRYGLRRNYELIPFKNITGVRLDHGIFSSAVFVRVMGYTGEEGKFKRGLEEGEIDGLRYKDAVMLTKLLNNKLLDRENNEEKRMEEDKHRGHVGSYTYCKNCGTRNSTDDVFCKHCGVRLDKRS